MVIEGVSIKLFEELAQNSYDGNYVDMHNEYVCENCIFTNSSLSLLFKKIQSEDLFCLKFSDVEITCFDFSVDDDQEELTADTFYRGRTEIDGKLIDFNADGKAYFYLQFVGGQQIEFWAKDMQALFI
ncbi:MAG: hypothetical protein EOP51_11645 [Sphingobacteriales bacterium]|nr:MAG: hypothetical protein EOP51_11645 [Sphingobacteriales bacterium]